MIKGNRIYFKKRGLLGKVLFVLGVAIFINFMFNQFDKEYKRRCLTVWGAGKCVDSMPDLLTAEEKEIYLNE